MMLGSLSQAELAKAMMSLPATKAFERLGSFWDTFASGFEGLLLGSRVEGLGFRVEV